MKKHFRKSLVAAAVMGAMAGGISGQASAFVYALSSLEVENFKFSGNPAEVVVGSYSFRFQQTAEISTIGSDPRSASCNGTGIIGFGGSTSCSTVSPVLNALASQVGTLTSQNNFSPVGTGVQYSRADSVLTLAELINPPSGSKVSMIAESNLLSNATAGSSSILQSTTGITFTALGGSNAFDLNFDADVDQAVAISEILGGLYVSQSNVLASVTVSRIGGGEINWTMQGNGVDAAGCTVSGFAVVVTCVETADGLDLNHPMAVNFSPSSEVFSPLDVFANFGIQVRGLPDGQYSVALNATVSTDIVRTANAVPEPASIALVGLGLLGMGVGLRRRNRMV